MRKCLGKFEHSLLSDRIDRKKASGKLKRPATRYKLGSVTSWARYFV